MDIVFAASTFLASPGIAAWGTDEGDVAAAALGLARGLRSLGHRATLVAPLDPHGDREGMSLARRLSPLVFDVPVGGVMQAHERVVHDARLPSGVEVVLLGGEAPAEATSADDRAVRLSWFAHAVAALARIRLGAAGPRGSGESELEAVVAVGEGAAMVPFAIREDAKVPSRDGGPSPKLLAGLARIAVPLDPMADVRLPRAAIASAGVADVHFSPEGVEFYGKLSFAKAAALCADRVIVLGEGAREGLLRAGAAHRLDGVYRARGAEVVSIGSGIDPAQFNPSIDPHLPARFDPEDVSGKARCKSTLLAELELDRAVDAPLVVIATGQGRGLDLATIAGLDRALRGEIVAVVALGRAAAESAEDEALRKLERSHPGRVRVRFGATEVLLHRVIGAGDLSFVVDPQVGSGAPARAAMRYGAVPIAPRSPSMVEAIVDLDASLATGTGFLFDAAETDATFGAIQRAVSGFGTAPFRRLQRRVMRVEGGWERAARRLEAIVQQLEG